jgi:hypothetical protein
MARPSVNGVISSLGTVSLIVDGAAVGRFVSVADISVTHGAIAVFRPDPKSLELGHRGS